MSIHPSAQVSKGVELGVGVVIGPKVIIMPGAIIGDYCIIGGRPESREVPRMDWENHVHGVLICSDAVLSEFVTVHSGTKDKTQIYSGVAIHAKSHVGHDSFIGSGTIIGGMTTIAGHVHIMKNAFVSGQNSMHQWSIIGAYAMLGAGSYLKGFIPPGEKWMSNPARPSGTNDVALERAGLTFNEVSDKYQEEFNLLKTKSRLP